MTEKAEPEIRVVDRRWWARGETSGAGATEDAGGRKPTYIEELEQRLAEQTAQLQSVAGERRKVLEEFEQVKARIRRETGREVANGKRAVVAEFLDVLDNLDRAIQAARNTPSSSESVLRGVGLVRDQFLAKLASLGVTRLEALGDTFDTARHEAVSTMPVSDPSQDGIVVGIVKEGYLIDGDLLRPSAVIVGQHGG